MPAEPTSTCGPHGQSALLKAILEQLITLNAALVTASELLTEIEVNTAPG